MRATTLLWHSLTYIPNVGLDELVQGLEEVSRIFTSRLEVSGPYYSPRVDYRFEEFYEHRVQNAYN